jgi:uncharacterized protein (TIGR03067 family)
MNRAWILLAIPCVCAPALAGEQDYEADLKRLAGTWKPVSMEMDGKFLPQERIGKIRLSIQGEKFTFDSGTDSHEGLYKIDPAKDPKQLDIVITRGDEKGKVYLVIYKFADGKMIQCMQVDNKQRPAEFVGTQGSGNLLEVWEKVK